MNETAGRSGGRGRHGASGGIVSPFEETEVMIPIFVNGVAAPTSY